MNRASADFLSNEAFDVIFQKGQAFIELVGDLEEAVVDR